jgi:hypothetical protein
LRVASVLIVLPLLLIISALVWFKLGRHPQKREFRTTDELVQWLANEAVQDAQRENHVDLDYTANSIKSVDKILGDLHQQYAKAPSSVNPIAMGSAYGAYVGEVIRKIKTDAKWQRDDPMIGEKSYPLDCAGRRAFPMGWCIKRIIDGPEDDISSKFDVFVYHYEILEDLNKSKTK